jgi:hypothetical protein
VSRQLARPRWTPRLLDGVSALLLLVAVASLLWRGAPSVTARAVSVSPAGAPGAAAPDDADSLAARVVATNLFSATRRTPRERFTAPGQAPAEPSLMPDPYASGGDPAPPDEGPRVVGIVLVNGVRRALIDAGAADSTPRLLAVGDRIAGYRVRRIDAEFVELSSSSGTRTVRLSRRSSPDSSESLP